MSTIGPVIISASYRTDIPTFYGEWFVNRLRAGYCMTTNPYNRTPIRVSLEADEVDGFVFWTRNIAPFMPALAMIRERKFPFVVQYTITGYPRELDWRVVDRERSAQSLRDVAGAFGTRVCVWRYDPIVITSLTPREFHLRNFERLAGMLQGATDEVVVSFAQYYKKTLRNMAAAGQRMGFEWSDPTDEQKRLMLSDFSEIAARHGMRLSICAQRHLLTEGALDARCIDPHRLSDVAGRKLSAGPRGHREACGCSQSRDIGDYETCPHGCVYCYAVSSHRNAQMRYRAHDPSGEYLFPPSPEPEGADPDDQGQVPER